MWLPEDDVRWCSLLPPGKKRSSVSVGQVVVGCRWMGVAANEA